MLHESLLWPAADTGHQEAVGGWRSLQIEWGQSELTFIWRLFEDLFFDRHCCFHFFFRPWPQQYNWAGTCAYKQKATIDSGHGCRGLNPSSDGLECIISIQGAPLRQKDQATFNVPEEESIDEKMATKCLEWQDATSWWKHLADSSRWEYSIPYTVYHIRALRARVRRVRAGCQGFSQQ